MTPAGMDTATPRICFYGDDFTGATDTLATATQAGLRSILFLRIPSAAQLRAAGTLDCLGIAGAARAMDAAEMETELEPVATFFAGRAPVTHYKICSTFDSAAQVGNIGVALRIWRRHIPNRFVAIVGGQPNLDRYCAFSHLFAAVRKGGEVVRIDRHDTMRRHPVTPLHESDLRLHLQAQQLRVAAIHYPVYARGDDALDQQIEQKLTTSSDAMLFDIAEAAHLAPVGRVIWQRAVRQPLLAIGASSVVQALCSHWQQQGQLPSATTVSRDNVAATDGPVFVLAGSLSPVTAMQIAAATSFRHVMLDAQSLIDGDEQYIAAALQSIAVQLRAGLHVLACTAAADGGRKLLDAPDAARRLAHAGGEFLRRLLQLMPLRRVGVAGGDTSSYALKALDIWGLSYLGNLAAGVALCQTHADASHLHGMQLMLKGGQMGGADLFELLVHGQP
ncbi:four-carbon acid sugar kinase family protein [Herbaspirillum autotrophicum]|uniref:four-carbon acid sugar kinase family protein n=1 Tax=Herbaspirillum autotrophicum TaxID=180195 RepID=UPI00067DFF6C|nr:four-carbon acid sugar kinase family protein [Herbaspirillum autotrophicum]